MKEKRIQHIGNVLAICNNNFGVMGSSLREDLPYRQYEDMPNNAHPRDRNFRMCKRCLAIIKKRNKHIK